MRDVDSDRDRLFIVSRGLRRVRRRLSQFRSRSSGPSIVEIAIDSKYIDHELDVLELNAERDVAFVMKHSDITISA